MKTATLLRTLALASLVVGSTSVLADDVNEAVRAALDEPPTGEEVLFHPSYTVFQHSFVITPVKTTLIRKGVYTVSGQLTRTGVGGKEDHIQYRIRREKGGITELAVRINDEEWHSISETSLKILGDYATGTLLTVDKQPAVDKALRASMDGTWQRVAEYLIIQVAVRHC